MNLYEIPKKYPLCPVCNLELTYTIGVDLPHHSGEYYIIEYTNNSIDGDFRINFVETAHEFDLPEKLTLQNMFEYIDFDNLSFSFECKNSIRKTRKMHDFRMHFWFSDDSYNLNLDNCESFGVGRKFSLESDNFLANNMQTHIYQNGMRATSIDYKPMDYWINMTDKKRKKVLETILLLS